MISRRISFYLYIVEVEWAKEKLLLTLKKKAFKWEKFSIPNSTRLFNLVLKILL